MRVGCGPRPARRAPGGLLTALAGAWATWLGLLVAAAAGALCRHGLDEALRRRWPRRPALPILLVNVTGSALLGALTGLAVSGAAPGELRTVLGTGFCGSFTTFSTACWHTLGLVRQGRTAAALAHAGTTVGASSAAAALGLALAG